MGDMLQIFRMFNGINQLKPDQLVLLGRQPLELFKPQNKNTIKCNVNRHSLGANTKHF